MKTTLLSTTLLVLSGFFGSPVHAGLITFFQSALRTEGADLDFTIDLSGWDSGPSAPPFFSSPGATFEEYGGFGNSGLGEILVNITNTGLGTATGSFHAFFDYEIDEVVNTFFNESATVAGGASLGTGGNPDSFEVDEPSGFFGDVLYNFEDGLLDNTNAVPAAAPEDVAVALGWDISLDPGEIGDLTLLVSSTGLVVPGSLFSITHTDPDSIAPPTSVTFSGLLEITGGASVVPEPTTALLLGAGVIALSRRRRRRA